MSGNAKREDPAQKRQRSGDEAGRAGRGPEQESMPAAELLSVDGPDNGECLDYKGAFWLATMGGAEALGLQVGPKPSKPLLNLGSTLQKPVSPT